MSVLLPMVTSLLAAPPRGKPPAEDEPLNIPRIVITGSRTVEEEQDAVRKIQSVNRQDLEDTGSLDAADGLSTRPGIRIGPSFRGQTLQVDGLPARYTLVLLNGRRTGGSVDGEVDLSRFRAGNIERIEVVRGPASTLYGSDAIGGVINIVTRRPQYPWEVELTGQFGSYLLGDGGLSAGGRAGPWSGILTADYSHRESHDLDASDPATDVVGLDRINITGDSVFEWTGGSLQLTGAWQRADLHGIDSSDTGAVFDRRTLNEDIRTSATLRLQLSDGTLTVAGGYQYFRSQYRLDQRDSGLLDQYEDSREHVVDATVQLDWLLPADHLLSVGLDGLFESLATPRLGTGSATRARGAVFIQDDWTALEQPNLMLVAGARLDVDELFGVYGTPQVSVRVDPIESLSIRAGFGLGYRAPRFKDMFLAFDNPSAGYRVIGNPELQPETSIGGSLTLTWRPTLWMQIGADGFYHDLSQLFDFRLDRGASMPGIDLYRVVNVADAVSRGVTGEVRFFNPFVDARLAYTFTDAQDLTLDRRLAGRPLHRGAFEITGRYRPWGLSLTFRGEVLGSRNRYEDRDGDGVEESPVESDSHALLGLRLAWDYDRWVTLYVNADNMTNAGEPLDLPVRPLTVRGGLIVRLHPRGEVKR